MKILILSNSYAPVFGGLQTVTLKLARSFKESGHDVRVITTRYPRTLPPRDIIDGITVDRMFFLKPSWQYFSINRPDLFFAALFLYPWTMLKMRRFLRDFQPDVVNMHFPDHQVPFVLKLKNEFNFRLIVSLHGHEIERYTDADTKPHSSIGYLQQLLRMAEVVTACSSYLLTKSCRVEPSLKHRGVVVHNGVDLEQVNAVTHKHPRPYLLSVGRLTYKKGFDILIRSFADVIKSRPELDLILAGDGEDKDKLLSLCRELGLQERVIFYGRADAEQVRGLMQGSKLVLIPSRQEPFGLVALEAMAAGKAVIASRVGGLSEFVSEESLVEPTVEGFRDKTNRYLDSDLTDLEARNTARAANFTWEKVYKHYLELITWPSLRVLILSNSFTPVAGGLQSVVQSLARGLHDMGHQVRVVANRYPTHLPAEDEIDGVTVNRLFFIKPARHHVHNRRFDLFISGFIIYPWTLAKLKRMVRRYRPDIVNIHFPDHQIPFLFKLMEEFDFRLVVSLHGHDVLRHLEPNSQRYPSALYIRSLFRKAFAVTACSAYLLKTACGLEEVVKQKGKVVSNGVDLERFGRKEPYRHKNPYIFAAGRLTYRKGFDILIDAFDQLNKTNPRWDLLIAGDGEEMQNLRDQVCGYGLDAKVHFLGHVDIEMTARLIHGSDVVAMPSRSEAFGMTALEALVAGKPLVTTNVGGFPELHKNFDLVLASPTKDGLADGLLKVLNDLDSAKRKAESNQIRTEDYSLRHMVEGYLSVFSGDTATHLREKAAQNA